MDYCIVNDGNIVINIIVSDSAFAEAIGALPSYDGAAIGEAYNPPPPPPTQLDRVEAQATYTAMMTDTLMEG